MKSIILSGAGGGIGRATLDVICADDVTVVCVDSNDTALAALEEQQEARPGNLVLVNSLLDTPAACAEVANSAPSAVTGFVHLAGVFEPDVDSTDTMTVYERAIQNNLTNGYMMAMVMAETMTATIADDSSHSDDNVTGASMVFTSSLAFRRGSPDYVAYAAAKGGLVGMTRALSRRLAPDIRVNAVAPGIINTSMPAAIIASRGAAITREIPLDRLGRASEVASVIGFLLSDGASYITGQTINVDGGIINS